MLTMYQEHVHQVAPMLQSVQSSQIHMLMIQPKDVYLNVQISHGHMLRMTRERVYIDALMTHLVRTQPVNVYKIVRIGVHSQRMIQHFV